MDMNIYNSDYLYSKNFNTPAIFKVKDPGSSITHFIGFLTAIVATPTILVYGASRGINLAGLISLSVFMLSMIMLYGASTMYHTFILPWNREKIFKKLDHMMISVLIAGSYTPICVMVLPEKTGLPLLAIIWTLALMGMTFKLLWVTCPKWISSVIYIAMGWAVVFVFPQLFSYYSGAPFALLLGGGIVYTIGGVIYALKFKVFGGRFENFGSHEVFHVCVMIGSLMHYLAIWSWM